MSSEIVVLKVKMSCEGCSGAVTRVLNKMKGVDTFEIDMEEQKVTVKGNVKAEEVFEAVAKTGKKTDFWVENENKKSSEAAPAEPADGPEVENENKKPSETAKAVVSAAAADEPENKKPSEEAAAAAAPAKPQNKKPSEAATAVGLSS